MATSIRIARILGPCLLVVALGIVLNPKFYQRVMEDYAKNAFFVFFGGIFALVIGVAIVLAHNVWIANWRVIITIYGWGGVVKGIWLLVFPESVAPFMQAYIRNKNLLVIHAAFIVVLGVVLTFLGYTA